LKGVVSVSVVIPTYNRAHLICDALNSVVAQTFKDLEIIVVDDGSQDDTSAIVQNWHTDKNPEITLSYIPQENAGGNAARNNGIEAAKGQYVAFLDSDDIWHPEKLAKQVELLETNQNFVAAYTGLREVEASTGEVLSTPEHRYMSGNLLAAILVSDVTAPTSTYVVRRKALHDAGLFDLDLAARQDWDMWIRLAELGEIGCVPETLVDLRHHNGPRTISDPTRELRAYERILTKYSSQRRKLGISTVMASKASYHRRAAKVHFHNMDRRWKAVGHSLLAILYWPFEINAWMGFVSLFMPSGTRQWFRKNWNRLLGRTAFGIRSH